MAIRLLAAGDGAVLVELDHPDAVLSFVAALRDRPHPAVTDVVPAERTVLVRFPAGPGTAGTVAGWLRSARPGPPRRPTGSLLHLDVVYDGADLTEVARLTGLSEAEVIAVHTGTEWLVAFSGFAPGFGYLRPVPGSAAGHPGPAADLTVPRRDEPRVRVPAGAVALAAGYSGVYPRASPGGWQLIGRTAARLWDAERDPPALLQPGLRVRFRAVTG